VSKSGFDASIGLAFSLELFKRYRRNGTVEAELPRMPGIRGQCKAFLQLVNGEVVSVYLIDNQGQRHSSDKTTLCRHDAEKGPFEWRLQLQPESVASAQATGQASQQSASTTPSSNPLTGSSVPRIVSVLPQEQLRTWPSQRRDAFYITLANIDGMNTVEEIKDLVPFPRDLIDELLRTLLEMKVIVIPA
jgi:hypothetical protein